MCKHVSVAVSLVAAGFILFGAGTAHALTLDVPGAARGPSTIHLMDVQLASRDVESPPFASDLGGGDGTNGVRPAVAFILGFFPGFGIGHLVAGSGNGFVTFLVVDVVLLSGIVILTTVAPAVFYVIGWVAWIVEHVFQGYDASTIAGGPHLAESSSAALMFADCERDSESSNSNLQDLAPAARAMSFDF